MHKRLVGSVLASAAALLLLPGVASAQAQAYTNAPVDVYAGPADDYPVVAQLPGGAPVGVNGCVEGYTWCDVEVPGLRGWVYGGSLSYPYEGQSVPVMQYGPTLGLPIVVFSIGTYWGSYYRDRPWYHDEGRWAGHPPPRGGPPPGYRGPPPGHGGPPPGHGGPPPGHEGPPPGHGGPPPGHEGPPPGHGGPPPGHEGPPPGHGGPPPGHGGPPPQGHEGPPPGHGGPPPGRGGPPQGHEGPPPNRGGGGGGHEQNGGNH